MLAGVWAGQVQDREFAVAQVDLRSVGEPSDLGCRLQPVVAHDELGARHGVHQYRGGDREILGVDAQFVHQGTVVQAAGRRGVERLAIMCPATREFVHATHVVEVAVGEHHDGIPFEQMGEVLAQGGDPEARVDDEVAVSSAQVPDVGSQPACIASDAAVSRRLCGVIVRPVHP
jgi:hypothetical protein